MKTLKEYNEALVKGKALKTDNKIIDNDIFGTIKRLIKDNILDCGKYSTMMSKPAVKIPINDYNHVYFWKNFVEINKQRYTKQTDYLPIIKEGLEKRWDIGHKNSLIGIFLNADNYNIYEPIIIKLFEKYVSKENIFIKKGLRYYVSANMTSTEDVIDFLSSLKTIKKIN